MSIVLGHTIIYYTHSVHWLVIISYQITGIAMAATLYSQWLRDEHRPHLVREPNLDHLAPTLAQWSKMACEDPCWTQVGQKLETVPSRD